MNYKRVIKAMESKSKPTPKIKENKHEQDLCGFEKQVSNFVDTIKANCSEEVVNVMFKNLSSLRIKLKGHLIHKYDGMYCHIGNKILLKSPDLIYHELMHMASNVDFNHGGFGFISFSKMVFLGSSINEGYTELLTARFFKDGKTSGYPIEVKIASLIEEVVGSKMMDLYFKGNLLGLIQELKQYASEEEIIEFLYNTEKVTDCTISERESDKQELDIHLREVYNFLTKIHFINFKNQLDQGLITEEECYKLQEKFLEKNGSIWKGNSRVSTYSDEYVDSLKEELNQHHKSR